MKIIGFEIKNFRSIRDSKELKLTGDIVTIIGQNESGKTNVLDALISFDKGKINSDDKRGESLPEITIAYQFDTEKEFFEIFEQIDLPKNLLQEFKKQQWIFKLKRSWNSDDINSSKLELLSPDVLHFFEKKNETDDQVSNQNKTEPSTENTEIKSDIYTHESLVEQLFSFTPVIQKFEDNASLLPREIDIEELLDSKSQVQGHGGCWNFLKILGWNKKDLQSILQNSNSSRELKQKIDTHNKTITTNFRKYWTQKIGETDQVELRMEVMHHNHLTPEKAGKPYLEFWIKDNGESLHPDQRSKGLLWFLSFYLQLEALHTEGENIYLLLIDEPGGSLHANAQKDILRILDELKKNIQIIFTTHSPYLIEAEHISRIIAAQRINTSQDQLVSAETKLLRFLDLGQASHDTLLPIYTVIGADLSQQNVISKDRNVILEEPSAFYYLSAIAKIFEFKEKIYFIPATGCSKIPTLANMFLGWGLKFCVIIDGDSAGDKTKKDLLESYTCDETKLCQLENPGIEDIFSKKFFQTKILPLLPKEITHEDPNEPNSKLVNTLKVSKPLLAYSFWCAVNDGKLKLQDFKDDQETNTKLTRLIAKIKTMLDIR